MYTVVIADDEQLVCSSIASVIRSATPEVRIAKVFHNGTDTYEYLQSNHADILLLDIEMPGTSGLDIAQFLNIQRANSYVIIITAYHNFDYAKRAIDCRVNAFLTKPFSSQQLASAVKEAISYFDMQNASKVDNRKMYRSLLQSLCKGSHSIPVYQDLYLCQGTTPISTLRCTSLVIKADGLSTLSRPEYDEMLQTLMKATEEDTAEQTTFLIGGSEDTVELLIFSKDSARTDLVEDARQIISTFAKSSPTAVLKSYPSFTQYRLQVAFCRQMDEFFKLLASDGSHKAKSHLSSFIYTLSDDERNSFVGFLRENHQICINESLSDTILNGLDLLVEQTLGTHSGNHIVDSAKKHIAKNYASSGLCLDSVAEALSISGVYLSRVFKKHTGQNFSEYLLNFRMEQARVLLISTLLPTTEVAISVGYSNPAYFRSSFKAYFGMTPRQYRQIQTRKDEALP